MKKFLIISIALVTLVSCSSEDSAEPVEEMRENSTPSIPVPTFPLDNTLCIDNAIKFEWLPSTDVENHSITYVVEISEQSSFSSLFTEQTSNATSEVITLPKGKTFYWRIKAIDSEQASSSYAKAQLFLTEGEGVSNHIPFPPALVSPEINSEIDGLSVTLSWTAEDIDMDPLKFDVYLDTNENPVTKVSENQNETSFVANNLSASTTYYFKVVVKDDQNGVSIGQVWSFKTK